MGKATGATVPDAVARDSWEEYEGGMTLEQLQRAYGFSRSALVAAWRRWGLYRRIRRGGAGEPKGAYRGLRYGPYIAALLGRDGWRELR